MPQNVLVFEVREAAGRSGLKERKSKKAKKSLSRERRELSADSAGQARVLSELTIGKEVRIIGCLERFLPRKVWPASVSPQKH